MGVEPAALDAVDAMVCIYDREHLVRAGAKAVVVFIPQNNDRVVAAFPCRGSLDGLYDRARSLVTDENEGGVKAGLCAVVVGIEIALRTGMRARGSWMKLGLCGRAKAAPAGRLLRGVLANSGPSDHPPKPHGSADFS